MNLRPRVENSANRNSKNEKVSSLQELRRCLEEAGRSSDYLLGVSWTSDRDHHVASNKVREGLVTVVIICSLRWGRPR